MRTFRPRLDFSTTSPEAACEHLMLGRIGSELAALYLDTFESSLPPRLKRLVERLEDVDDVSHEVAGQDA